MHSTQIVASIIALVLIHFINPVYLPGFVKLLIKKHIFYITVVFCIITSVVLSIRFITKCLCNNIMNLL